VVAELVPPAEGRSQTVDDVALAELVRQGCLTPPLLGPGGDVPRRPVPRSTRCSRNWITTAPIDDLRGNVCGSRAGVSGGPVPA
jgi:hypothetical protein